MHHDYAALVTRVREAFRQPFLTSFNDDMDDWLESHGLPTYTDQLMKTCDRRATEKQHAKAALWEAGAAALPEVRKALKGRGWWRRVLLEFIEEFGGGEDDLQVLRLISRRRRDVLVDEAAALLGL